MDDYISRQAAIAEIMEDLEDRSLHDDQATPEDYAEGYDEGIRNAAAIVLQMPSAQPVAKDINVPVKDCISRQAAIEKVKKLCQGCYLSEHCGKCLTKCLVRKVVKILEKILPAQPGCEDVVPRTSVEYICQKNTVSTNPYEHKYHDKFIQFMEDPEISDFGRWQHSNGFNTALVAVKCDLDKVPSVTPKPPEGAQDG